jgi:hypothetical protein
MRQHLLNCLFLGKILRDFHNKDLLFLESCGVLIKETLCQTGKIKSAKNTISLYMTKSEVRTFSPFYGKY